VKKICLYLLLSFSLVQAKDAYTEFIDDALKSDDVDRLIVAGLLAKSFKLPYTNQQLYAKAIKLAADNILLLEQVIRFCDDDSLVCKKQERYVKRLEKVDAKNAVPNLYAAVYYGKNNQFNTALKYLIKGSKKTVFDEYNWNRFFLVHKVLENNGYTNNKAYQVAYKSIYMGHVVEPLAKIMNLCEEQSKTNPRWKSTCIQFGKVIETSSKMVLSTFVGYAIQRDVLALDEADIIEYESVKHRRDVFHQFRLRAVANIKYASLGEKVEFDKIPGIFFQELEKFGEKVALQRALDRLKDKVE